MKNRLVNIIINAILLFLISIPAHAVVTINVNPLSSASEISFGRFDIEGMTSSDVKIRISSTDGKPYQVYQRLVEPMMNDQGQSIGRQAVETYTLSSSSAYGSLYLAYPEPLTSTDQLIYSSGQNGDSDNFTVIYKVNYDKIGGSGNFRGRLIYTVRSTGGSSPENEFINISVEGGEDFKTIIKGASSLNGVTVKYDDGKIEPDYLDISFNGNPGENIRIYQLITNMPQNEVMQEINSEAIVFKTEDNLAVPAVLSAWENLSRKKVLLYESNLPKDEFRIAYSLNEDFIGRQKAGLFKGSGNLIIERSGETEEFNISMEIDILPIFRLEVELPPEGIKFEKLLPNSPPLEQELNVAVKSNLGSPYVVMQSIGSPLMNAAGDEIPGRFFTMKAIPVESGEGQFSQAEYTPITTGQQPIFFSDKWGNSAVFKVLYRLRSFPELMPGDYSTAITYSLGEK